jgi:thiol-disulfide isomerase/thioredoxin
MANGTVNENEEKGIIFNHSDWNNILKKAAEEQKLIFVDCYTTWCGPCKMMAKKTFTQEEVGNFFNKNFINVKLDMEKEPGLSLKTTFGVTAYPTLLVIDAKQNIIHKSVGALQKEALLKFANEALNGSGTLSSYHEKYKKEGIANKAFVLEYLLKLEAAGEKKKLANVTNLYFEQLEKKDLLERKNWNLLKKYVETIHNKAFQLVLKNQDEFIEAIGKKEVEDKVYFTFLREGNQLCDKNENGDFVLNKVKKKNFLNQLKKNKVRNKEMIKAYSEISTNRSQKDWKAYINSVSKYLKEDIIDKGAMSLYNYALPIERAVKDQALRAEVAKWCDMGLEIEGLSDGFANAFKKLKDQLIDSSN